MILTTHQKQWLADSIRHIPDFPQPGIAYKDITTLLNNKAAFRLLMDHLEERYHPYKLDYIAGVESRGFIFGAPLADRLGIGFVPIRKKGKLPSTTLSQTYELEYGVDEIEIHMDAFNHEENATVLLIDDLIATGGTAVAAAHLIKEAKTKLVEICFLLNITSIGGVERLKQLAPVYSVLDV